MSTPSPTPTPTATQLALIKRTYARGLTDDEFELFRAAASRAQLDILSREIIALVHNANDPQKRALTLVTTIDGLRTIAARTGAYRPDTDEPRYEYDAAAQSSANSRGLVSASVAVYRQDATGEWHPARGVAYWDEYAPTYRDRSTGEHKIGGMWAKMPRHMLAKCAEAIALRKSFPIGQLYIHEELEQAGELDLPANEIIERHETAERLARLGGAQAVPILWERDSDLEYVPIGEFADRSLAHIRACEEPSALRLWAERNREALRRFWAAHAGDALAVRQALDARIAALDASAASPE